MHFFNFKEGTAVSEASRFIGTLRFMNKEQILSVLKELYSISGFRVSLYNTSFEKIVSYPEKKSDFCCYIQKANASEYERCIKCDREAFENALKTGEPTIYKCRHNLLEAVCPLFNFGILTGFLLIGQVRIEGEGISSMLNVLAKNGKTDFEAREIASGIPSIQENMIKSYVNVLTICASHLTLSNSISSAKASVGQMTMKYITENFTEKIGVQDICLAVGYSKSTVLSAFKKEFGVTVNSYLNTLRLERAKKMLENGSASVSEIALSSGFSDQSYFSKVFSAAYGITPTEYRRDKQL